MSGEEEALIDSPAGLQQYMAGLIRYPGVHARRLSNGGLEMSVVVKGTVYGTSQEIEFATDPQGRQLITPGEMAYTELSRQGAGWQTMATSAVAALVVRPSTAAALELWNGNAAGGPSLVIDRLFSHNLVAVANSAMGMYAMVTTPKAAPSTASLAITGNWGKAYAGLVIPAVGTTVVANGWYPYGPGGNVVTVTTPGVTLEAQINGRIIVPPQCSLCVHVVASTTSATFTSGASWFEKTFAAGSNPLL